jgi:hypothetical protein
MNDRDTEGFLQRWSRRKREQAERADTAVSPPAKAEADAPFADFDFEALDFTSDYRQFMGNNVPDEIRNRALQKLWASSDLIAQPDELDAYLEDFRETAKALPADLARSAYIVGCGFPDQEESDGRKAPGELAQGEATAKDDSAA